MTQPKIYYENGVWIAEMPEGDRIFSHDKHALASYVNSRPLTERQVDRIAFSVAVVIAAAIGMAATLAAAWLW